MTIVRCFPCKAPMFLLPGETTEGRVCRRCGREAKTLAELVAFTERTTALIASVPDANASDAEPRLTELHKPCWNCTGMLMHCEMCGDTGRLPVRMPRGTP